MILFSLFGGFCIWGAVGDFDWFVESDRVPSIIRLFGRQGVRIFYISLGLVSIAVGIGVVLFG